MSAMATEDGTDVTFTWDPARLTPAGGITSPYTVTLDAGQTYLIRDAYTNETVSGVRVSSTKAIAVISGSQHTAICGPGLDAGIDQLIPHCYLGQEYALVKHDGYDQQHYAVAVAIADATEVRANGATTVLATLDAGDWYRYDITGSTGDAALLQLSKPGYVYQFSGISQTNNEVGMAVAAPIDQCSGNRNLTFLKGPLGPSAGNQMLSISIKTAAVGSVRLNGNPVTGLSGVRVRPVTGKPDYTSITLRGEHLVPTNELAADDYFQAALLIGIPDHSGLFGYLTAFAPNIETLDPNTAKPSSRYILPSVCAGDGIAHTLQSSSCHGNVRIVSMTNNTSLGNLSQTGPLTFEYAASPTGGGADIVSLRLRDDSGTESSVCITIPVCGPNTEITGLPNSRTLECGASIPSGNPVVTGNTCPMATPITFTDQRVNGACDNEYKIVRTWETTADCGFTIYRSREFVFVDTKAPVFASLPDDIVVECDATSPPMPTMSATDLCDPSVSVVFAESACSAGNYPAYYNMGGVTMYLAEVASDPKLSYPGTVAPLVLTSFCTYDPDLELRWRARNPNAFPVYFEYHDYNHLYTGGFVVPANTDLFFFTPRFGGSLEINWEDHTGATQDTRKAPSYSKCDVEPAATCGCTTVRTWTATDECGNAREVRQRVHYIDRVVPTVSDVPADVTLCAGEPLPTTSPTFADGCSAVTVAYEAVAVSGSPDAGQVIERRWAGADACGNTVGGVQRVTYAPRIPATGPNLYIADLSGGSQVLLTDGERYHTSTLPASWNIVGQDFGTPHRIHIDLSGDASGNRTISSGGAVAYPNVGTALTLPRGTYSLRTRIYTEDAAGAPTCYDEAISFVIEDFEICNNGIDDDGDGLVDTDDTDCGQCLTAMTFTDDPNWHANGNRADGSNFGWTPTNYTAGVAGGELGGVFHRASTRDGKRPYYAQAFARTYTDANSFSIEGELFYEGGAGAEVILGFFDRDEVRNLNWVGLHFNDSGAGAFRTTLTYADGNASSGNIAESGRATYTRGTEITMPSDQATTYALSYDASTRTISGRIGPREIPPLSVPAGRSFSVNSFGLSMPEELPTLGTQTATMYFDALCVAVDDVPVEPEVCNDGIDNDRDGSTDCGDAACASSPDCGCSASNQQFIAVSSGTWYLYNSAGIRLRELGTFHGNGHAYDPKTGDVYYGLGSSIYKRTWDPVTESFGASMFIGVTQDGRSMTGGTVSTWENKYYYTTDANSNYILSLDLVTGIHERIELPVTRQLKFGDLGFDAMTGLLYGATTDRKIFKVDPRDTSTYERIDDETVYLSGLAIGVDGVAYATRSNASPKEFGRVNLATGEFTALRDDNFNPSDATVFYCVPPAVPEICGDGIDNDLDGLTDADDPDCFDDCTIVTHTGDSGYGSLRQAIICANEAPGLDTIVFNIPMSDPGYEAWRGVFKLEALSTYPSITDSLLIDGLTQTAFTGNSNAILLGAGAAVGVDGIRVSQLDGPEIEIYGHTTAREGFVIKSSRTHIRGIAMYGFYGSTILLDGNMVTGGLARITIEQNVLSSQAHTLARPSYPAQPYWQELMSVKVIRTNDLVIRNNMFANSGGHGVQFRGGPSVGAVIENNEFLGNASPHP